MGVLGQLDLRLLGPGDEAALEAFLRERLESSMFLLGNAHTAGLLDEGNPFQGTYVAAFEKGCLAALAAHYWNQNLVVQAPTFTEAVAREAVRASRRMIKGILGPAEQVERVEKSLGVKPSAVQINEQAKLYTLFLENLLLPKVLTTEAVRARRAELGDSEILTRFRVAYTLETLGEVATPELWEACRASVRRYIQEDQVWLLEAKGAPVACSTFNAVVGDAVQVGGVYTLPERCGRGYGRGVVAASLRAARADGIARAVLFTPERNLTARRAYKAIGFRAVGDYRVMLLNTALTLDSDK